MNRTVVALAVALPTLVLPLCGQQTITSASLSGRLQDPSGQAVAIAPVTLLSEERQQSLRTSTDEEGRFRFLYVPPGPWVLQVNDARFAPLRRELALTVGQAIDVPLTLAIPGSLTSIEVQESPVLLETVRTQVSTTILPREVDALPLNGRNYLDLALLAPGVSRTNTGAAQRFAETSAVPGTGVSVSSQRNLNNTFVVDGLSANDDAADLAGTFFSQEVIREFQVVTSGGIAEFGRASSGVVNVITKAGGNQWHGRLYGFLRNQRLDARNPLASQRDPLTQTQYGASLGGPLRLRRTFVFGNFEQTRQQRSGVITITPVNTLAVNQALDGLGYRGGRASSGSFPTGYDSSNGFVRVDHQASAGQQWSLRYSLYDVTSRNARTVGGLNAISRGSALDNRDQTVAVSQVLTLSPVSLNELRGQFTRSRLGAPINDPIGPAVTISGVASLGTATSSPLRRDTDLYELADSFSRQTGRHLLKAGANFLENRTNILFPGAVQGSYTFANLAALASGRYVSFQQAFGAPQQFQANPNAGFFVQDEWRATDRLTFNAGLRYDLQWLPAPVQTDTTNLAPRFGVAYAPGDRKTVLRFSYGLYFDRLPLRATSNALQRDGSKYRVAVLAYGQEGAPVFPAVLDAFPAGQYVSITTIDPAIRHGYSHQASGQIERELRPGTSLAVGYQWLRSLHLILSRNLNVPTLSAAEAAARGIANLGRPDARYGNISRYESSGTADYNGLLVSLRHQTRRGMFLNVAYTYSKAIDTIGNFFFSTPQDNTNLRDERGLSDNDQRHRLTISAVLPSPVLRGEAWHRRLLSGWELSPLFLYTSALPFNVQTGNDRNNDTNVNDRPWGVGRNTGRGFNFASLDVRLSRAFTVKERWRVQALAEAFNSLNRFNRQLPNNIYGTGLAPLPAFGQATAAGDPRQVQLGLRVDF